ncbi:MAG: hypothetical protein HC782_03260 [Gammaproteobacteria bacterium]|nr:hypothetical protein [Gammaproteobacteria bacterium]
MLEVNNKPAVDVERSIARIKESDIKVKAWCAFSSINAPKRPSIGEFENQSQALRNVTVGVKDIIDVAGLPTRMGSPIFDAAPPALNDATCVALMRQAGAVIIGKTVTTELASFVPSTTCNPLNLMYTPGGSWRVPPPPWQQATLILPSARKRRAQYCVPPPIVAWWGLSRAWG